MKYYLLRRIIIIPIACIIIYIMNKKVKKHIKPKYYSNLYSVILIIICYITLYIVPFENHFMRFSSLDKIIEYEHPKNEIVDVLEYDNYAFVIYIEQENYEIDSYNKIDNRWIIYNDIGTFFRESIFDECFLQHRKNKKANASLIALSCDKDINITDSLKNEFKEAHAFKKKLYYTIVKDMKEDYYIKSDNEKLHKQDMTLFRK